MSETKCGLELLVSKTVAHSTSIRKFANFAAKNTLKRKTSTGHAELIG